ncbi:MAG: hypothetical protein CBC83_02245 [Flavobacteriales bacterium TMED123]|nr:hypothetical protein [Candidatus Neomarinimicrobiota bacterium]MAJ44502.1 hypothetical protein [Candidatus Neomarinimicrobiota bacterium]OUV73938.1 MAG: hypothetical protein CBC83_04690 [Flavobacteriales bacterium TMED123]OUV75579.1 MAG: hypothetical protein CBC83_02245 [Flavobacteriales bacterium TMED123]|tara:strand:+ start:27 stop:923 length:897 start_codon:yes stop_codon:yes gene_type:complete
MTTTEVTTIDTNNYAVMAKAMGMGQSATEKKTSALARLRIVHQPIMGQQEIKGKIKNVEVIPSGVYKLEIPDGGVLFSKDICIRPFLQRYMYKKFIMGSGDVKNRYVKTVMGDSLNIDMKDNDGGFNCGKPSGWIEDFQSLPDSMKDLIRSVKRVRVLFGVVDMIDCTDINGDLVEQDSTPFIYEIENKDAFKIFGGLFNKLGKMQRLPPQHYIRATTDERELPNGNSFFVPKADLDLMETLDMDNSTQETFGDFMSWIGNYNQYILNEWSDKMKHDNEEMPNDVIDDFIDLEEEVPF